MQRPSWLMSTLVSLGQNAHSSPVLFFFFGYFLTHPSFNIILLLIIGLVHSGIVPNVGSFIYSINNSLRVYYDFLIRFSGCKATEQFIEDLGIQGTDGKTHPIKVFQITKNKNLDSPTPISLCAYISDKYSPSYLFLTESLENMRSDWQKLKLWHEIGHINQGAKDLDTMINMLALGWKSFFFMLLCIMLNIDIWGLSTNNSKMLMILTIIVFSTFGILINNIKKREWTISELEADRFALIQIGRSNLNKLLELHKKISSKNFLYDTNVSERENQFRQYVFLNQIEELKLAHPKGTFGEMTAAAINSIAGVALIFIGTMSKNLTILDIVINFLVLVILPFAIMIGLYIFRIRGIMPSLEEGINAMKKGEKVKRVIWLEFIIFFAKLSNGDFIKDFKKKSSNKNGKTSHIGYEKHPGGENNIERTSNLISVINMINATNIIEAKQIMSSYMSNLNQEEMKDYSKFVFTACDDLITAKVVNAHTAGLTCALRDECLNEIGHSELIYFVPSIL